MTARKIVERWESRGGRYFVEIIRDRHGISYRTDNGGGFIGDDERALDLLRIRIARGDFQADRNTTPMERVR